MAAGSSFLPLVSFEPLLLPLAKHKIVPIERCLHWGWSRSCLSTLRYRHTDLPIFLGILLLLASKSCHVADTADFLLDLADHCLFLNYVLNHLVFNTPFGEDSTSKAGLEISTVGNAVGGINTGAGLNELNMAQEGPVAN